MSENLKFDDEELAYEDPVDKVTLEAFGIKYIFPWQRMVITNILEAAQNPLVPQNPEELKDSINRQIVLLPTGAGKSLCFQVPALLLPRPTLVIYPLLALMSDQQRRMTEGGIKNVMFRGGQSREERERLFQEIENGAKIIIANPEVLGEKNLLEKLKSLHLSHVAIDEAHCVSEWGDSFRPAYLNLNGIISELSPDVVTAFTATASPEVLSRVSEVLFGGEAHIIRSESDRPNIHYYVKYAAAKQQEIIKLAESEDKPMIVFCGTRKRTEEMSRLLNAVFGNSFSRFYHAGLEKSEKDEIESWFFHQKNAVLCATCAYGMGVDKKDIHTVIHLDPPLTAEAYIQEAGRGGRDGSVANGILIWNHEDKIKFRSFPEGSRNRALMKFAVTKNCRRQVLLDALGAEQAACAGCDICDRKFNLPNKGLNDKSTVTDVQIAEGIIKKNERIFSHETFLQKIQEKLNEQERKNGGLNIYDHKAVSEIAIELYKRRKIRHCRNLWKGKLETLPLRKQIKRSVHRLQWQLVLKSAEVQNFLRRLHHLP